MDNNETLRRKFLDQKQSPKPIIIPKKNSAIPAGQKTFDQHFRNFTAKIDSKLKDIIIAIIIGAIIGYVVLIAIGQSPLVGNSWIIGILIWVASGGLVYWYLHRSEK